jgi:6-phosphogluconolactonase
MRQIVIKKTAAELTECAAEQFHRIALRSLAEHGVFSVALSGGSTPRSLYTLLASAYRDKLPWEKIRFFFGDERNVAPDHPESNYRMARETLLDPLEIDEDNTLRWRTELGVAAAADDYEQRLRQNGRLDLVLLGLGADAHTASLFPHTAALQETGRLAIANWVDKLNDFRMTTTFPLINNADNVMFIVAGSEKAEAVAAVLEGVFQPDEFPAQRVRPPNGNLFWLLDSAAAVKQRG